MNETDPADRASSGGLTYESLSAQLAIQQLVSSFVYFADRGRADDVASLFNHDGTLEWVGIARVVGREAIRGWIEAAKSVFLASPTPGIRHHCSSVHINIEGDRSATVSSYWLAVSAERGPDHWGRYRDVVTKNDSAWLFHHRQVRVDGQLPDSVSFRAAQVATERTRPDSSN